MGDEWGPWIEHDGNECPCVGAFVHSIFNGYGVYQLTGNRTNEVFAVATGNRSATIVIIGMGAAVILVFLFVDVPDIGSTGMFNAEIAGNIDATGKAEAGLWLELVGGVVLVLGGLALRSLNEEQLRSIGPQITGDAAAPKKENPE